ncbi:hypothetical protein ACSDQ9_07380 [Aestuariimicrobium soli]|uniref:hypothetical protein n=1 Tax=Aestuariimicrobium soli TaxID=2035834 RepID=UPI003EBEAC21
MADDTTPELVWTADLVGRGHSQNSIKRWVRSGTLERLTWGAYLRDRPIAEIPAVDSERRHLLRTKAVLRRFGGRAAASHHSGALLHGLPVWGADLGNVHLTRDHDDQARRASGVIVHQTCRGQQLTTTPEGWPVLGVADCVVGVGLGSAPRQSLPTTALVAADAALHQGLVSFDELDEAVARLKGYRGIGPVRAALVHADGRHESPAETRMAVFLRATDLPFVPQYEVWVDGTTYRSDFKLIDHPVLIEVDGMGKYGDPSSMTPDDISRALKVEKQREDALRSLGHVVVRVTWDDLRNESVLRGRIRAAIDLARRLSDSSDVYRPSGNVRPA